MLSTFTDLPGNSFVLFPVISALGHFVPKLRPGASAPGRSRWGPRASPAKRVAWGEEEQGSACSFRRKAEAEQSGLCDDEGLGRLPNKHFGKHFCRRPAQKFRVCSHSNCLPKTQVWLHLPCLPLVKRPQNAFLIQCENKYHSTPLTDHSCSYILYLKPAPQEGQ